MKPYLFARFRPRVKIFPDMELRKAPSDGPLKT